MRQYPLLYWRTESSPLSQLCASLRSSQDSYSQQVEFRSSIHGPLQCFQAVDVPFCRSAAPFILDRGGHGRAVAFQSCRQTLHLPNSALRHSFHPTRECFPISLVEDAVEFPRKDLRLGDLRRHFYQMFYEGSLFGLQFLGVSQKQPGCQPRRGNDFRVCPTCLTGFPANALRIGSLAAFSGDPPSATKHGINLCECRF